MRAAKEVAPTGNTAYNILRNIPQLSALRLRARLPRTNTIPPDASSRKSFLHQSRSLSSNTQIWSLHEATWFSRTTLYTLFLEFT